jgi:alpha-N-arabinofuranosidase
MKGNSMKTVSRLCVPIRFNEKFATAAMLLALAGQSALLAQSEKATEIKIQADQVTGHVSPTFYGLMTEEINYSYDGGLYAELVRNRNFKEDPKDIVHWQLVQEGGATGSMSLDPGTPFNEAVPLSLKLVIDKAAGAGRVGIANDGFWGIPSKPNTTYKATFYAKASPGFNGPITLSIVGNDGTSVRASAKVSGITQEWKKFEATLTTGDVPVSAENKFVLTASNPGTIWFGFVSLFPPTYKDRPNGFRPDIMQLLAGMKPAFLRFPGGNYLEGNTLETRFDWKKTIGDVAQRPGHFDDAWWYWSSDGMGLLEFLNWCEDLNMEPVLGVYAGYSLRGGARITLHSQLQPFIQDALDEIEYVTGDVNTTWGARRAKDGHPAPFKMQYVEVGNEDGGDNQPGSYETRFAQFFDAIKAKYPNLKVIATDTVTTRVADVIDEHYYRRSEEDMASHASEYDSRRVLPAGFGKAPHEVFVGEWATRVGDPTPTWTAALGDAAWMVGMERNAHLVKMEAYAPLFTRVDPDGLQWLTDLIGYNTLSAYGSPSYYMQSVFATYHGDDVLSITAKDVPNSEWLPPAGFGIGNVIRPGQKVQTAGSRGPRPQRIPIIPQTGPVQQPAPQPLPLMHFNATRDSKTGTIYVKVVNRASTAQAVHVALTGISSVEPNGRTITLSGSGPDDTNSITEPTKIVPVIVNVSGLGSDFTRSFPPYSVSVLELKTK